MAVSFFKKASFKSTTSYKYSHKYINKIKIPLQKSGIEY